MKSAAPAIVTSSFADARVEHDSCLRNDSGRVSALVRGIASQSPDLAKGTQPIVGGENVRELFGLNGLIRHHPVPDLNGFVIRNLFSLYAKNAHSLENTER